MNETPLGKNRSLIHSEPKRSGLIGWLGIIGIPVIKFGYLALKSFKTSFLMLVMIFTYSWIFGWKFGVGFGFLVFTHQMGHVIAAKCLGMPVTNSAFIPFFGTYVMLKQHPRDAWTEALMAYGGPLGGCIGSWICWGLAIWLQMPWLMAVASASFAINLFSMIPVLPMDGGRICVAVAPWFGIMGLVLLGATVSYFPAWHAITLVLIVILFALLRLNQTFLWCESQTMQSYYFHNPSKRLGTAVLYVGLISALFLGYWDTHRRLGG